MYPALQYTKRIFALSCPKVLVLLQHWLSPKCTGPVSCSRSATCGSHKQHPHLNRHRLGFGAIRQAAATKHAQKPLWRKLQAA